eukprot:3249193-Pleurochrysis_carterae.AAC.3
MHCPIHGQWWSKRSTHTLHSEQCEARGGRQMRQVWHHLSEMVTPDTPRARERDGAHNVGERDRSWRALMRARGRNGAGERSSVCRRACTSLSH